MENGSDWVIRLGDSGQGEIGSDWEDESELNDCINSYLRWGFNIPRFTFAGPEFPSFSFVSWRSRLTHLMITWLVGEQ